MLSSVLFGLVLRIYERAYPDSAYEFIWNGFWTFVVTTTTIGYGEIYPKSHLGRFIAMISCILGMCMISLLVISFANFIEFEND